MLADPLLGYQFCSLIFKLEDILAQMSHIIYSHLSMYRLTMQFFLITYLICLRGFTKLNAVVYIGT
jgi:hypothetical protein